MKSPPKKQHLMTDNDFAQRLTINLLLMSTALIGCTYIQPLHDHAINIYYNINDYMMQTANRLAWWSLLGLLSSSCCALQIILNALSFGCAGFNAVLGPLRPTFVAFTIVAQSCSWYVAYPRPYQWGVTAFSTGVSSVLTLLPELLAWRVAKRQQQTKQQQLDPNCEDSTNGLVILSGERLLFRLDTMGCASCVSTVSILLDGLEGVMSHKVTLEDGLAEVLLAKSSSTNHVNNNANTNSNTNSNDYVVESSGTKHDTLLWKDIAAKLEAAGFPAECVEGDSKKHR